MKKLLFILLVLLTVSSCKIYTYPQQEISHVLAVTKQGDTIQVPLRELQRDLTPDYYNGYQFYWNNSWLYYNDWYYNYFYRFQRPYIPFRQPRIKTPKYQQPKNYPLPSPPRRTPQVQPNRGRSNNQVRIQPRQNVQPRTRTTPNVIQRGTRTTVRNRNGNQ